MQCAGCSRWCKTVNIALTAFPLGQTTPLYVLMKHSPGGRGLGKVVHEDSMGGAHSVATVAVVCKTARKCLSQWKRSYNSPPDTFIASVFMY